MTAPVAVQANGLDQPPVDNGQSTPAEQTGDQRSKTSRTVDLVHKAISGGITGLADRLDQFFADERTEAELQTTRIRVRPTIEFREDGNHKATMPLQLNLVLPRTEKKWQIRLTRTFTDDEPVDDDPESIPPPQDPQQEDTPTTFLAFVYTPVAEILENVSVRAGPRFEDGTVKLAAAIRYRKTWELASWAPRFRQTFFYDGDEFGMTTRQDFDRSVGDNKLFRAATSATFSESSEGLDLEQSFLWRWFVTEYSALSPEFTLFAHTRPATVADEYRISVPYRRRVWKDWLRFTVTPQLSYPRELGFDRDASLFLSLEATF